MRQPQYTQYVQCFRRMDAHQNPAFLLRRSTFQQQPHILPCGIQQGCGVLALKLQPHNNSMVFSALLLCDGPDNEPFQHTPQASLRLLEQAAKHLLPQYVDAPHDAGACLLVRQLCEPNEMQPLLQHRGYLQK